MRTADAYADAHADVRADAVTDIRADARADAVTDIRAFVRIITGSREYIAGGTITGGNIQVF